MLKYITILLLLLIPCQLLAEPIEQDIRIEWTYDDQPVDGRELQGFNLYKEGTLVCSENDPMARLMDCVFMSELGTFNFTLTAVTTTGYESSHSPPYIFKLTEDGAILIAPQIISVQFD